MASRRNLQNAVINTSASGQSLLISNPSSSALLYIWDMYLTVAAATNLQFYDGPGPLTGNINLGAGGQFNPAGIDAVPMFTISPGSVFNVSSTAAVQQSGWLSYSS